ncbi:MAG: hypothetical protein KDA89_10395 [Planctomycetaceae bacterium]|nr:hypothetical protein [Planctomycetaceae bacterium]
MPIFARHIPARLLAVDQPCLEINPVKTGTAASIVKVDAAGAGEMLVEVFDQLPAFKWVPLKDASLCLGVSFPLLLDLYPLLDCRWLSPCEGEYAVLQTRGIPSTDLHPDSELIAIRRDRKLNIEPAKLVEMLQNPPASWVKYRQVKDRPVSLNPQSGLKQFSHSDWIDETWDEKRERWVDLRNPKPLKRGPKSDPLKAEVERLYHEKYRGVQGCYGEIAEALNDELEANPWKDRTPLKRVTLIVNAFQKRAQKK